MKKVKRLSALLLAGIMTASAAGCGSGGKKQEASGKYTEDDLGRFSELELGKDYTDIKADLKVITPRSDLVNTDLAEYTKRFQEMYPNVTISYDAPTDYAEDMTLRLSTDDWGDVCMIVSAVDKNEFSSYFVSFGKLDELNKKYTMLNNNTYQGEVYGIPSMGNAQGVAYNKKVFEEAGIKELPKTPDEFLNDLQLIKDKTDAIPMYTNFSAGWTMTAWDAYIGGTATGDKDFKSKYMVHGDNPFAKKDDMTGPYAVYYTLYEAVKRGLVEDDPTTSDWEGSKGMINRGEIGCMVLGSWAVSQLKEAGDTPDDIAYMPFPISVNGKQYSTAGPDYCYGINIHSSIDNQLAAMLYVKWMTEESGYAVKQGGIPVVQGAEYPELLKSFNNIEFIEENPAPAGEETLFNDINTESEVGIDSDPYPKTQIVEAALTGSMTLDEIMDEWNSKWTAAQVKLGAK